MLQACKTLSKFFSLAKPTFKTLALLRAPFLCYGGNKAREESPACTALAWDGSTGTGAASAVQGDQSLDAL